MHAGCLAWSRDVNERERLLSAIADPDAIDN
jgi:hypothetical protein